MCSSIDASGNYHLQEYQNQLSQIQGKYHTIDAQNSDAYFKEIEGIYACTNFTIKRARLTEALPLHALQKPSSSGRLYYCSSVYL